MNEQTKAHTRTQAAPEFFIFKWKMKKALYTSLCFGVQRKFNHCRRFGGRCLYEYVMVMMMAVGVFLAFRILCLLKSMPAHTV